MDIKAYIESGKIESFVLGLTDENENAEIYLYSKKYPEIKKAIDDISIELENYIQTASVSPPAGIKEKIISQIHFTPDNTLQHIEENSIIVTRNSTPATVKNFPYTQWMAAASFILFVLSAFANYVLYNKYKSTHENYLSLLTEKNELSAKNKVFEAAKKDYDLTASLMSNPAIIMIKLKSGNGKPNNATVFWNADNKDVYVSVKDLPEPPANKQLQLWAIENGKPVDAGVVDLQCKGICKMKNILKAQAFAITIEPIGGNPTPTLSQLMVIGNV